MPVDNDDVTRFKPLDQKEENQKEGLHRLRGELQQQSKDNAQNKALHDAFAKQSHQVHAVWSASGSFMLPRHVAQRVRGWGIRAGAPAESKRCTLRHSIRLRKREGWQGRENCYDQNERPCRDSNSGSSLRRRG